MNSICGLYTNTTSTVTVKSVVCDTYTLPNPVSSKFEWIDGTGACREQVVDNIRSCRPTPVSLTFFFMISYI